LETQRACVAPKDVRALQPPEDFGRGIAMADAESVIEDHDGVVRPLDRDRQQVGCLGRRAVLGWHQGMIREKEYRARGNRIAPGVSKGLCDQLRPVGKIIALRIGELLWNRWATSRPAGPAVRSDARHRADKTSRAGATRLRYPRSRRLRTCRP